MQENQKLEINVSKLFKERIEKEAKAQGLPVELFIKACLLQHLNSNPEHLQELKSQISNNNSGSSDEVIKKDKGELTEEEKIEAAAEKLEQLHGENT